MPLVFVHGVNTRYDPKDDPKVEARDAMFRRFVMHHVSRDARNAKIFNPYWGDLAATFPYKHGGLPEGSYEAFGGDDADVAELLADAVQASVVDPADTTALDPDRVLIAAASRSLPLAVDVLWTTAGNGASPEMSAALAELAAITADYVDRHPNPDWVATVENDEAFAHQLVSAALADAAVPEEEHETFGISEVRDQLRFAVESIRTAVVTVRQTVTDVIGKGKELALQRADYLLLRVRTPLHRTLITFLGDAFVYFRQREAATAQIGKKVSDDILEAARIRTATGEPLVIVAHSMGGNIVHDLLTSTLAHVDVDVLVTVGSQVGVMEELRLFSSSNPAVPSVNQPKMKKAPKVQQWINVFDTFDPLGFAASRVFDDVKDYRFRTGHAWAHGGYFVEPMFHQRLGERLKELGLP